MVAAIPLYPASLAVITVNDAATGVSPGPSQAKDGDSRSLMPGSVAAILLLAVALRAAMWAQQRSLWLDEARLALNVASRSYLQLLSPLDYDQVAPPLFLWLQRTAVVLCGINEGALRLVPLIAGIVTVALVGPIGKRLFSDRVGLLTMLLCAISPSLIGASSEAKQYGIEALAACGILYATLRWMARPVSMPIWLLVVGAVGVWLAPSAVFVLAAAGVATVLAAPGRSRGRTTLAAVVTLWWGGSAVLAYLAAYQNALNAPYLHHYWGPAFLTPGRAGILTDTWFALRAVLWGPVMRDSFAGSNDLGNILLVPAMSAVIALIVLVGVRRLIRVAVTPARVLVLMPPALALLTSVLGSYPISARTTMFYLPILLLLLAGGLDEVSSRVKTPYIGAFAAFAPICLLLLGAARELYDRDPGEDMRPLVATLRTLRGPGEPLYVFAGAIPAWTFYSTDWTSPDLKRLDYLRRIARSDGPAFENAPRFGAMRQNEEVLKYKTVAGLELYGSPTGFEVRVFGPVKARPDPGWVASEADRIRRAARPSAWLLFSHFYGPEGELLDELDAAGGQRTYQDMRNAAALIRYDFPK